MFSDRLALAAGSLLLLAGCAVGPDFERPRSDLPAKWAGADAAVSGAGSVATPAPVAAAAWWQLLNDAKLNDLVKGAMDANLDLKAAGARLRQARAARGIAAGAFWPRLDASGSYSRSHAPTPVGGSGGTDLFRAGLDAAWELDIFGGTRRGIEAADADVQAAAEDERDVLVSVAAEVALNYLDLRGFQQRLRIARDNLAAQRRSADLTRQRFDAGLASGLDVANADAAASTTEAQVPVLEAAARQTIHALSVLLGRPPAELADDLSAPGPIPRTPGQAPVGLPSDLLQRRPDIRRAEAQLHAATARVGVARADYFPHFTLTGAAGYQSDRLSNFVRSSNLFWSFGPNVNWNLFSAGRTRAAVEQQRALVEQSAIAYRRAVLTALREVEDSLVAFAREQEHRQVLTRTVAANRKAVTLATQLYTEGQTDFLNVLSAQRSLYNSEDALVQSDQAVAANLISLYKALGGGWEEK